MTTKTTDPSLKSWIETPSNSDFPIQNLPFGIYSTSSKNKRVGVAIGNEILDLASLHSNGYLKGLPFSSEDFISEYLNKMMMHGKQNVSKLRERSSDLLSVNNQEINGN